MSIHTHIETTNAALASRGLLPVDGHCKCAGCKIDTLDREEMANADEFRTGHLTLVEEHFGGKVCTPCAENVTCCDDCGDPTDDGADTCGACLDEAFYDDINEARQ